jgi:hypothetical protein
VANFPRISVAVYRGRLAAYKQALRGGGEAVELGAIADGRARSGGGPCSSERVTRESCDSFFQRCPAHLAEQIGRCIESDRVAFAPRAGQGSGLRVPRATTVPPTRGQSHTSRSYTSRNTAASEDSCKGLTDRSF